MKKKFRRVLTSDFVNLHFHGWQTNQLQYNYTLLLSIKISSHFNKGSPQKSFILWTMLKLRLSWLSRSFYIVFKCQYDFLAESPSQKKRKKSHKHRKSSSRKKTAERKRRLSTTSVTDLNEPCTKERKLNNLQDETLDNVVIQENEDVQETVDIKEMCESDLRHSHDSKEHSTEDFVSPKTVLTENASQILESVYNIDKDNNTHSSPDLNSDSNQATIQSCANSPSSLFKDIAITKVDSVDSGRGSSVSASDISVQTPGEADSAVFTNFTDSVSSLEQSVSRDSRQNSDMFDSGLCSPASDKGSVGGQKETYTDNDTYREPLPSALAGVAKSGNKGKALMVWIHVC